MINRNFGKNCECQNKITYNQLERLKIKIMLDPGHGGEDIGERQDGVLEKDKNLEYARAVGELLKGLGYEVVYTRETDIFLTEEEKRELANTSGADLFVSLHRTSNISNMEFPGVEAIVINPDEIEMNAARNLTKELSDIGFINLGIIRANGYTAEYINYDIPQVFLLTGIYKDDNDNYDYEKNFIEIVDRTARGITNTLKVQTLAEEKYSNYKVQVAIFRTYMDAHELQQYLVMKGYRTNVLKEKEMFCVCCGDFEDLDKAVDFERFLKKAKYNTLIIAK